MLSTTVYALATALCASAQATSSFDGNTLHFSFIGTDDLYDGSSDYKLTRIESTGYGYWVTTHEVAVSGQSGFNGISSHNANQIYIVPSEPLLSNETVTVSFEGAFVDAPPSTGSTTYSTIYNVWFQPSAGGNSVSRSFQDIITINWDEYPDATPILVADMFSVNKNKRALVKKSILAKRYTPVTTTLASVDGQVGIFGEAGNYTTF